MGGAHKAPKGRVDKVQDVFVGLSSEGPLGENQKLASDKALFCDKGLQGGDGL